MYTTRRPRRQGRVAFRSRGRRGCAWSARGRGAGRRQLRRDESMNSETDSVTWDCIIVGAGPAGLNAALVLGRARRRVLVLDSARPRNYATREMHGVVGHDGLDPADLRARGRTELGRYGVEVVTAEVQAAEALDGTVRVTSPCGADLTRTVLLATGMLDEVPDIPGFAEIWGTTAHTCPYCDGFEHRDERLAILAAGARGEHLAIVLRQWSDDVVLLSNDPHARLSVEDADLPGDRPTPIAPRGLVFLDHAAAAIAGHGAPPDSCRRLPAGRLLVIGRGPVRGCRRPARMRS